MCDESDTERNHEGERETLYDDEGVTLRRYQSGRYGLTVGGLRVVFSAVRTPPATSVHEFLDAHGEQVASIRRSDVPHEVTATLDGVEMAGDVEDTTDDTPDVKCWVCGNVLTGGDEDGGEHADAECWVCGKPATHQDKTPPHEYTCDDHAMSIDAERIAESPERPTYVDNAEYILNEAFENWNDLDDTHRSFAVQRAFYTLKHEMDDIHGLEK